MRRTVFVSLLSLFIFIGLPCELKAESYPSRPVKIIVPYPAGGIVDVSTRIVTDWITADWGQPIVVENRPGANGNIGANAVRNASADGYTLLIGSTFLVTNPLLDHQSRISDKALVPIGTIGVPPNFLVVPAASSARQLQDIVALARARPGEVSATNPGIGSSNHLGTELFQSLAGIEFNQIGYKGQPPFIPDLLANRVDFAFASAALVSNHLRDGKLRALAVSHEKRLKSHPDVPTVGEAGYPQAVVLPWTGLFAPAGTPDAVLDRLTVELKKALQSPEVIRRYEAMEAVNPDLFRDDFSRFLTAEDQRWRRVLNERNIKAE
ncbi:MFS transporter [Betaproteobacteria bacterium]|nr:MFS transporter [Betaproteobacteria bacterium]